MWKKVHVSSEQPSIAERMLAPQRFHIPFMSFSTTLSTTPGEVVMYHRLPVDIVVALWSDENLRDASAAASPLAGVSLEDEGSKTFVRITLQ